MAWEGEQFISSHLHKMLGALRDSVRGTVNPTCIASCLSNFPRESGLLFMLLSWSYTSDLQQTVSLSAIGGYGGLFYFAF